MLLPYRVKVSYTKVTHFTPMLALCTCLYRSHLGQPVSTKQTKHNRKSEAQNEGKKSVAPFFLDTVYSQLVSYKRGRYAMSFYLSVYITFDKNV